jgi:hypothetical protein
MSACYNQSLVETGSPLVLVLKGGRAHQLRIPGYMSGFDLDFIVLPRNKSLYREATPQLIEECARDFLRSLQKGIMDESIRGLRPEDKLYFTPGLPPRKTGEGVKAIYQVSLPSSRTPTPYVDVGFGFSPSSPHKYYENYHVSYLEVLRGRERDRSPEPILEHFLIQSAESYNMEGKFYLGGIYLSARTSHSVVQEGIELHDYTYKELHDAVQRREPFNDYVKLFEALVKFRERRAFEYALDAQIPDVAQMKKDLYGYALVLEPQHRNKTYKEIFKDLIGSGDDRAGRPGVRGEMGGPGEGETLLGRPTQRPWSDHQINYISAYEKLEGLIPPQVNDREKIFDLQREIRHLPGNISPEEVEELARVWLEINHEYALPDSES